MYVVFFVLKKGAKVGNQLLRKGFNYSLFSHRAPSHSDIIITIMQGGIRAIFSHGKNGVLRHMRVDPPAMFAHHKSTSVDEHGFENTKISDILTAKGKSADGSWLWCTTQDSVYDVVKSMTQHNVGALLVVKPGEHNSIAGIITERDYLRKIIVQGRSSKSTNVGDIMTEDAYSGDQGRWNDRHGLYWRRVRAVVSEHRDELNRLNAYIQGGY